MTTLADSLKPLVWAIRAIPGQLGIRPYTVEVVTVAYAGAELGEGALTESRMTVTEYGSYPPRVRNLSSEEIALAGYDKATWEIGPITPDFTGGGTALSVLTQSGIGANTEPHIVMTGPEFPNGANFRLVKVQTDKALHFTIQVQRVAD
jgi:hypothetical protein